jgi:hypothetical protein
MQMKVGDLLHLKAYEMCAYINDCRDAYINKSIRLFLQITPLLKSFQWYVFCYQSVLEKEMKSKFVTSIYV